MLLKVASYQNTLWCINLLHRLRFKALFFFGMTAHFLLVCIHLIPVQWSKQYHKKAWEVERVKRCLPRALKGKWSARFFNWTPKRTKIRQRLAFQYGIYAVKCVIYPFVTPESSSDMRARAEADVTRKHRGEGVKYRHVAGISPHTGAVLITHLGKAEAWDQRSCDAQSDTW